MLQRDGSYVSYPSADGCGCPHFFEMDIGICRNNIKFANNLQIIRKNDNCLGIYY